MKVVISLKSLKKSKLENNMARVQKLREFKDRF